ncbi:hypothetical protein SI65_00315 [Aspergillus cristatus]|uniref:Protein phosphatase 4 core regulatory subunit R2 n=1 Tax=Aspergillus cristatus TaxID=573508 RepID=A0A1E3BQT0_ASPCR|nr:hypothetical protein SI65_00315 [Aspergillus cristatus]
MKKPYKSSPKLTLSSEKWAGLVEPLVERLEYIVYNIFPMPKMPPEAAPSSIPHQLPSSADPSSQDSSIPSSSNKENNLPDLQTPPRPAPTSAAPATSPLSERVPDSQSQSFTGPTNESLPAPLALLLDSIKFTLRSLFSSKPPHTIQRLAELILHPNAHYRTLPAYLRAVDRVVSVTSSAEIFPLQVQASTGQPNGVTNGGRSSGLLFDHTPGSDESLGGALLTPIPWLNAASFEEENGEPVVEAITTESISITVHRAQQAPQGEQQQQPQPQEEIEPSTLTQETTLPTHTTTSAIENEALGGSGSPPPADSEEVPHARGPPVVGVEDMGLQDGKGVEMPLSNVDGAGDAPPDDNAIKQPAQEKDDEKPKQESASASEEGKKDGDGDISLDDVKGKNENESATGSSDKEQKEQAETEPAKS